MAAQPLARHDPWWHLGYGQAHPMAGPWLPKDALLYTAPGPPVPEAWLADVALAGLVLIKS